MAVLKDRSAKVLGSMVEAGVEVVEVYPRDKEFTLVGSGIGFAFKTSEFDVDGLLKRKDGPRIVSEFEDFFGWVLSRIVQRRVRSILLAKFGECCATEFS